MFTSMVIISPRVIMTVIEAFPALQNYQLGIVMIPTFILPGGTLVVGAEDPSVLAAAMMKCLAGAP